ncbi:MAG: hypothetical protein KJ000_36140 [Pirellulaceae bacterium]|nr:hypothetical protein [Pirellulaceae bacterium]
MHTASLIAGLLTVPALQSNCVRLEALAHLALYAGAGGRRPTPTSIGAWFDALGGGPCGFMEDSAEDAFTRVVTTAQGNFLILEGIWESAAFYLQRIVDIVETTPGNEAWLALRESVRAMLKLSDLVCERSGLVRYTFGNPLPDTHLCREIERTIPALGSRVVFSVDELLEHGIALESLEPFLFDPDLRKIIAASSLTHSPLVHHPLLLRNGQLVVALPTAMSVAIRGLVAGGLAAQGLKGEFLCSLAREYEDYFREHPPLGLSRNAPLQFQETDHGVMASIAFAVDVGRWLQLIFVLDTLEGFEETAFAGANSNADALAADFAKWRNGCRRMASQRPHYRGGLTVIVGCGIGRAAYHRRSGEQQDDWRTVYLSAPDVATLSELGHVDAKTLWRIFDAKDRLAEHGIELSNLNGLLNLVAWVRALDGHLVEHSQTPPEWAGGGQGRLMIDPSMVLQVRRDAAVGLDRHAVPKPDGVWTEVRKTGDSLFAEDRETPLYVTTRTDEDGHLPIVYAGEARHWWCRVTEPREYARWKLMTTWLPRVAAVLDRRLASLPTILLIEVSFDGYGVPQVDCERALSREAIAEDIRVTVDQSAASLVVAVGSLFEVGLCQPENVAEAALVAAVVRGCCVLADCEPEFDVETLIQSIVDNEQARDCHGFQARCFRDLVMDQLQDAPVGIDQIDAATLRLGLGWRVRSPDEGGAIEGRGDCNAFLNSLVLRLEEELCRELSKFDRRALIEMALRNHELAMARQATWRRTASAILGLHRDRGAAMRTIAKQQFENNGVLQASRVLVELAVCECPEEGGVAPGEMDLSLLMAQLMLLTMLGDWSDAIYHGGMEATLFVTPLGDVHVPTAFLDEVVKPFGHLSNDAIVDGAIADYARNFTVADVVQAGEPAFDQAFIDAWQGEKHAPLDSFRRFVDDVEDYAIEHQTPILTLPRSELLRLYSGIDGAAQTIVSSLTTTPRGDWRAPPEGMLDKDRWPWRHRRRLSLVRLPIVQLDDGSDPLVVVAPGLLRDALIYTVKNYHSGYFPDWQIDTPAMKAWTGTAAIARGHLFSHEVAESFAELGWKVEPEVKVSKILAKRLNRDYGDIDVLAWNPTRGRVLLVECKDLHFHKTAGELAEQLSDYRGEVRGGKRDDLRKHLDRIDVLRNDADALAKYVGVAKPLKIEGWIVFRNPVPMLLATEQFGEAVRVTTLARLAEV